MHLAIVKIASARVTWPLCESRSLKSIRRQMIVCMPLVCQSKDDGKSWNFNLDDGDPQNQHGQSSAVRQQVVFCLLAVDEILLPVQMS